MSTRRYSAFISYRHADNTQEGRRWAEWLHRALERYVVPPDLVGIPNLVATPIRDSLYPIFRDEDELPANADLATGIRAALEVSDYLIVLCSPRSAVSPWVRKEVREFKELGRSDRILAIIIAGEPNADDPAKARAGIMPEEECFCEELRFGAVRDDGTLDWTIRTEPLASDLRPIGTRAEGFVTAEGYREHLTLNSSLTPEKITTRTEAYRQQIDHALLKVIAGLLGVPLGQLKDRDAAHRTALAEAEANRQREIAERERQLAEQAQKSAHEAVCAKLAADRTARRLAIAGAGTLILAMLTGWFWWQAQSQAKKARAAAGEADSQRAAAQMALLETEKQRATTQAALVEAETQRQAAVQREAEALAQKARSLMIQGVQALKQGDPRGVCHLTESLRSLRRGNPARTALLATLQLRRWPWLIAEGPSFSDTPYSDRFYCRFENDGTVSVSATEVGGEVLAKWKTPLSVKTDNDSSEPKTYSMRSEDDLRENDEATWFQICRISEHRGIWLCKKTRQWSIRSDAPGIEANEIGPVTYVGDMTPLFAYNEELDALAVWNCRSSGKGEYVINSIDLTPVVFRVSDRWAIPTKDSRPDLPGVVAENEDDENLTLAVSQLKKMMRLETIEYGSRVEFDASPDGKWIAAGGSGRLWLCSPDPAAIRYEYHVPTSLSQNGIGLFWSPDSRYLIVLPYYGESEWTTPCIMDMEKIAAPKVETHLRIGNSDPIFTPDGQWVLTVGESQVDLFDLPSRGSAASLTWEWPVSGFGEIDHGAVAISWLQRLLSCDDAPDWLLDLSEAVVGAKLDPNGAITVLDDPAIKLSEAINAVNRAPEGEFKEWAERWLARFDDRKIITGVNYDWKRTSDMGQETIMKAVRIEMWNEFSREEVEAAIIRAWDTGLIEGIRITNDDAPGGMLITIEVIGNG